MMKIYIFLLLILSTLVYFCQGRIRCSRIHPCRNGGICQKKTGKCFCPQTYFGELCEHMNKCHKKCPYGKVCIKTNNGTECGHAKCSPVADIVFILDRSGSINKKQFITMLNAVKTFVMKFDVAPDKIQVAAFAFNDHVSKRIIRLNDCKNRKAFLKELRKYAIEGTGGGTRTDRALKYLRNNVFTKANGDRDIAPNIALIFTDGKSNKPLLTKIQARKLKNTDISVISIGIGNRINIKELECIASRKDEVFLTDFNKLPSIVGKLVNKTCDVSMNPCYTKPCKNGGECHSFLTGYMCNCKDPYIGVNCETKCDVSGDIMIAIDESGSITQKNFNKLIDSLLFFIKTLDIKNGKVRVGLITFALDVFAHYDLDAFHDKLDMLFVVNLLRYQYRGGPTFTHKALNYLRKISFTTQRGDRMNYKNYVIFISDGKSHFPWKTKKYATALHRSGVTVYAVGIGYKIKKSELYFIASRPKKHHMILTTFKKLKLVMMKERARICEELKRPPCMECRNNCKCLPGMKCCRGCCQDTVTVLICPNCAKRFRCEKSIDCFWPYTICSNGCCRTSRYIHRHKCRVCRTNRPCPHGFKCCRGCCMRPKTVEAGCMGDNVCQVYPPYRKCGKGLKCCHRCYYDRTNYVFGFGKR